jgi:superfamily II DNA or RNA helicase
MVEPSKGLAEYPWRGRYATSQMPIGGRTVDLLHDFYIPVLERSTRYDRVAGYFSSSSLAVASQGFSRFVENGGRARFIVGAQLDFDDVRTIVDLTTGRVEQALLAQLDGQTNWPESVQNGVALLAWMLRHGHLEVRVGFRVDQTDQTLHPMEYSGDGYLHEKWALFGDGDSEILVSGSLNESKTALSINAENLTLQPSWRDEWNREAIEDACVSFEALWKNENPAIQVYELPEAVQQRLIQFADRKGGHREIDGTPANLPSPEEPEPEKSEDSLPIPARERLAFALIRLAPLLPGGEYVGMETAPVTPWPHQRFVAERLIANYPCNRLLCDEVGLGKTIEAGLVFRSLWLSGRARSIRVFAPASLTSQWLHEMAEKFFLPFKRRTNRIGHSEMADPVTGEIDAGVGQMFDHPLEIISTGLINHGGASSILGEMPETDLVILDEAHKARRSAPDRTDRDASYNQLYKALQEYLYPRAKSLLLATATPMQINRVEAFDLLKAMPVAGNVQFSEDLCDVYYRIRSRLLEGDRLENYEKTWLQRYLSDVRIASPDQWEFVMEHVLALPDRVALETFIRHGIEPPDWASVQPAITLLAPLGRAMLRHNRQLLREYQRAGLLQANLAFRSVQPVIVTMGQQEAAVQDALQDYCGTLSQMIGASSTESRSRAAVGFYLSFLRQRLASSFHALRESLKRRLEKIDRTMDELVEAPAWSDNDTSDDLDEDEVINLVLKDRTEGDLDWERQAVQSLLRQMTGLPDVPEKTKRLLDEIQRRRIDGSERVQQVVIFTRYADTMEDLFGVLNRRLPGCPIGTFSGGGGRIRRGRDSESESLDRTAVRKLFMQQEIDILICTDAAAEGLNLQTADLLINFDLPWNPMLLEQRIGRIDRIGQRHDRIHVHNYLYQNSVEEVIYLRLVERFRSAIEIAGELQFALLPINEKDFQDLAKSPNEPGRITLEELLERAQKHARQIQDRQQLVEFSARKQREVYDDLARQRRGKPCPVTLEQIWEVLSTSEALQVRGCSVETISGEHVLVLCGIDGVDDSTVLTASRSLFERGLPDGDERILHFASYGDRVFETLLDEMLADEGELLEISTKRLPLRVLRFGEVAVAGLQDLEALGSVPEEAEIEAVYGDATTKQPASDQVGKVQLRVLREGAASLAEEKLRDAPDTTANQLARIDSFERDLSHRAHQSCYLQIQPSNQAQVGAYRNRLLWPVESFGSGLRLLGDPLFVQVARPMLERTLQRMQKARRTSTAVAGRLRD